MPKFSFVSIVLLAVIKINLSAVFLPNLTPQCYSCLCNITTDCDRSFRCSSNGKYCGPFYITKDDWNDAGKPKLKGGNPKSKTQFEDCVTDYNCAKSTLDNYFKKYGMDCNADGVTDCEDYAMMLYNGGPYCEKSLSTSTGGKSFLKKFKNWQL